MNCQGETSLGSESLNIEKNQRTEGSDRLKGRNGTTFARVS